MGIIRDFFRKQVKEERNELAKKYHGEYTNEELMKKAAESVLRKNIKRGAITLSCAIIGIAGFNILNNNDKNIEEDKTVATSTSDLVRNDAEIQINESEDISSKIDEISTKEEALSFIKEMYVEEYNKVNKTDLTVDDITFISSNQDYVYDVDGVYITHGSTPDDVKNSLDKNNKEYEIKGDVKVYTSYVVEDGKKVPLESFSVGKSDIVNVILGDEYINGEEISIESKNVLASMSSTITNGIDLAIAINNENSKDDIVVRKYNLEKAIEQYKEQNEIEIPENEIGG